MLFFIFLRARTVRGNAVTDPHRSRFVLRAVSKRPSNSLLIHSADIKGGNPTQAKSLDEVARRKEISENITMSTMISFAQRRTRHVRDSMAKNSLVRG